MKTKKYYVGMYKNGQDFAKVVDYFGHETEEEAVSELVSMHKQTDFDSDDDGFGLSEETLKEQKTFGQDTKNWGIFELSEDEETGQLDAAITKIWGSRNFESNQL